jgi:hypothetical protein
MKSKLKSEKLRKSRDDDFLFFISGSFLQGLPGSTKIKMELSI